MRRWYDVALWRVWPALFPTCTAHMQATTAAEAIEGLMREARIGRVMHAAAYAQDRSFICRVERARIEPGDVGKVCVEEFVRLESDKRKE